MSTTTTARWDATATINGAQTISLEELARYVEESHEGTGAGDLLRTVYQLVAEDRQSPEYHRKTLFIAIDDLTSAPEDAENTNATWRYRVNDREAELIRKDLYLHYEAKPYRRIENPTAQHLRNLVRKETSHDGMHLYNAAQGGLHVIGARAVPWSITEKPEISSYHEARRAGFMDARGTGTRTAAEVAAITGGITIIARDTDYTTEHAQRQREQLGIPRYFIVNVGHKNRRAATTYIIPVTPSNPKPGRAERAAARPRYPIPISNPFRVLRETPVLQYAA